MSWIVNVISHCFIYLQWFIISRNVVDIFLEYKVMTACVSSLCLSVPAGCLLLLTGLCTVAHGGLCGTGASAGDGLWLVRTSNENVTHTRTHSYESMLIIDDANHLLPSISMQSIQNLGLALIAMAAGAILDNRGYLFLEVFFCTCICCQCFMSVYLQSNSC